MRWQNILSKNDNHLMFAPSWKACPSQASPQSSMMFIDIVLQSFWSFKGGYGGWVYHPPYQGINRHGNDRDMAVCVKFPRGDTLYREGSPQSLAHKEHALVPWLKTVQNSIKRKISKTTRNLDTLQRIGHSLFSIRKGWRKKRSDKTKGMAQLMRFLSKILPD